MHKWVVVLWLVVHTGFAAAEDKDKDKAVSPPPSLPSAPRCSDVDQKDTESWCTNPIDAPDAVNICIDAQTGCIAKINNGLSSKETGVLIPPSRGVIVTVHAPGESQEDDIADVSINLAGTIGLVLPATYGETKNTFNYGQFADLIFGHEPAAAKPCVPKARSYVAHFAPRSAGAVPLTVTVIRDQTAAQKECKREESNPPAGPQKSKDQKSPTAAPAGAARQQPGGTDAADPPDRDDTKPPADEKEAERKNKAAQNLLNLLVKDPPSHSVDCHLALCAVNVTPPPPAQKPPAAPADESKPPKGKVFSYEFLVPKTFGGALRIGFGAIHVDGLAHVYGVRKVTGTDFSQIVDGGADPVSAELVVGYAPFVFAKYSAAGARTYTSDENPWTRIAPFFGVGVLSSSPTASKPEFLRSFYLGIEYELTPGSSIAIAGVLRRVDALASGFEVGMTVDSAANITRTTFELGWGVVFNVTPGFFQFAASALPK